MHTLLTSTVKKKLKSTEHTWDSELSMSHSKGLGVNPLRSKRTTLHIHKYFHIHVDILTTVGGWKSYLQDFQNSLDLRNHPSKTALRLCSPIIRQKEPSNWNLISSTVFSFFPWWRKQTRKDQWQKLFQ